MGTGIPSTYIPSCTYISYARKIGNALFRDRGWMSFEKNLIIPRIQNFKVNLHCAAGNKPRPFDLFVFFRSLLSSSINHRRKWKAMLPNLSSASVAIIAEITKHAGKSPFWGMFLLPSGKNGRIDYTAMRSVLLLISIRDSILFHRAIFVIVSSSRPSRRSFS